MVLVKLDVVRCIGLFGLLTTLASGADHPKDLDLPPGVELVNPKDLGLSDGDLDKFLGKVKLLSSSGGGGRGPSTQILTVGFGDDEKLNLQDFEQLSADGLEGRDKDVAKIAFNKFKQQYTDIADSNRYQDASGTDVTPVFVAPSTAQPQVQHINHHHQQAIQAVQQKQHEEQLKLAQQQQHQQQQHQQQLQLAHQQQQYDQQLQLPQGEEQVQLAQQHQQQQQQFQLTQQHQQQMVNNNHQEQLVQLQQQFQEQHQIQVQADEQRALIEQQLQLQLQNQEQNVAPQQPQQEQSQQQAFEHHQQQQLLEQQQQQQLLEQQVQQQQQQQLLEQQVHQQQQQQLLEQQIQQQQQQQLLAQQLQEQQQQKLLEQHQLQQQILNDVQQQGPVHFVQQQQLSTVNPGIIQQQPSDQQGVQYVKQIPLPTAAVQFSPQQVEQQIIVKPKEQVFFHHPQQQQQIITSGGEYQPYSQAFVREQQGSPLKYPVHQEAQVITGSYSKFPPIPAQHMKVIPAEEFKQVYPYRSESSSSYSPALPPNPIKSPESPVIKSNEYITFHNAIPESQNEIIERYPKFKSEGQYFGKQEPPTFRQPSYSQNSVPDYAPVPSIQRPFKGYSNSDPLKISYQKWRESVGLQTERPIGVNYPKYQGSSSPDVIFPTPRPNSGNPFFEVTPSTPLLRISNPENAMPPRRHGNENSFPRILRDASSGLSSSSRTGSHYNAQTANKSHSRSYRYNSRNNVNK